MDAPRVLIDAEEWLATANINTTSHDENCHKRHSSCMVQRLATECRILLEKVTSLETPKPIAYAKPPIRKTK